MQYSCKKRNSDGTYVQNDVPVIYGPKDCTRLSMVPTSLMVAFALGVSFCRGATSSCRGDTHTSQHAAQVNGYLSLSLHLQLLCGLHAETKVHCKMLMAMTSMGSDGSSLCMLHLNLALFVISKHNLCPGLCTVGLHRQQHIRQSTDAK
jgi:hypothetical protein